MSKYSVHTYMLEHPGMYVQLYVTLRLTLTLVSFGIPRLFRYLLRKLNLFMVKLDGQTIGCIEEQTRELCLAAVYQNGMALKYIWRETPEVCLAAVRQRGLALYYVKNQTPEICMAAVRQDQYAEISIKDEGIQQILKGDPELWNDLISVYEVTNG